MKRKAAAVTKTEWPDPILTLQHIVGFSNAFPHALQWLRGSTCCIYASVSTIVIRDLAPAPALVATSDHASAAATTGDSVDFAAQHATEHFLQGHTAPVCGLALSSDGALLASAELGSHTIRVWDVHRRECITALRAHARGVHALCFSLNEQQQSLRLCAVGHDDAHRVQILVWDCSALERRSASTSGSSYTLPVIARQTCDFPITTIAFSPYELDQLVSCGKENVRCWRIRKSHVVGSPVILNEYARGTVFTDVGFDPVYQAFPSNMPRMRPLYVSSSLGTLLLIDYDSRDVVCVYQLHDSAINCVSINEGFCVTGSDDRYLRVWPLDFADFFLEAQHEAGVASVQVSRDGLRVLVGSRNGAIGVLDISDQRYDTVLRSHTQAITAMAHTPVSLLRNEDDDNVVVKRDEIVTTSSDGTLRIWDASSGQQLYEFDVQHDDVTCLVVSPVDVSVLAVGFASGCTRVFDLRDGSSTRVVCEFQQHQSALCALQYDTDGAVLYTSAVGRQLCMYDAQATAYTPVKMLIADLCTDVSLTGAAAGKFCVSRDKRFVAMVSADQQRIVLLHARSLCPYATITPSSSSGSHRHHGRNGASPAKDALKDLLIASNALELLALSRTDRLYVYSLATLQLVQSMQLLAPAPITALALSPNLKYMATGSADGSLSVWRWDATQRFSRMHQRFVGQTGELSRVCFTSDGAAIVASGSASTLFVWSCHGETGQFSPLLAPSSTLLSNGVSGPDADNAKASDAHDSNDTNDGSNNEDGSKRCKTNLSVAHLSRDERCDAEEMSPSLHVPVPSSKPQFSLELAMDALVLSQDGRKAATRNVSGDDDDAHVETATLQLSATDRGRLTVSSVVHGLRPDFVAWSYTTGSLVFAMGSAAVVEDIASGRPSIHSSDLPLNETTVANDTAEVVQMCLSPSQQRIACVTAAYDAIVVTYIGKSTGQSRDAHCSSRTIALPVGIEAIDALAFVHEDDEIKSSSSDNGDDDARAIVLSIGCRAQTLEASGLFIVRAADNSIEWSRVIAAASDTHQHVHAILSITDDAFVTFAGDNSRLDVHEITSVCPHDPAASAASHSSGVISSRTLLESFASPIQIVCPSPWTEARDDRPGCSGRGRRWRRHLLCVDSEAFCSVMDLARKSLVVTSQLMLHASERRQRSSGTTSVPIDFIEWIRTSESQCLVRGSRSSRTLCIHRLPLKAARTSSASVDWQLVARSGLPILYSVELDAVPLSLSVDPHRGLGIVATADGVVSLLKFKDGAAKRVVKKLASHDSAASVTHPHSLTACWAMDNAMLLTLDTQANAVVCFVPETAREVARISARGAACTAIAVNSSFPPLSASSCAGSLLLAGYADGVLRAFDVSEMKLLAQTQLPLRRRSQRRPGARSSQRHLPHHSSSSSSVHKTTSLQTLKRKFPGTGASPQRLDHDNEDNDSDYTSHTGIAQIRFVGSCAAVVVLTDHRVVLVDLRDIALTHSTSSSQTRVGHCEREIVYREVALSTTSPSSASRQSRSSRVGTRVVSVDVKPQVEASFFPSHLVTRAPSPSTAFPFLLVTTTAAAADETQQVATANVFGWSEMLATSDDAELAPTDEWCLDSTMTPTATFLACAQPHVLYAAQRQHSSDASCHWCLEVRDYLQQSVLQRFDLDAACSHVFRSPPMRLLRLHSSSTSSRLLLVDACGTWLALDLVKHEAIQIDTAAVASMGLALQEQACAQSADNCLVLSSSAAVGASEDVTAVHKSRRFDRHRLALARITIDTNEG